MRLHKKIELGLIIAILALFFLVVAYLLHIAVNMEGLKNYVASFGIWVPFVLLMIVIITSSIGLIFTIPVAISSIMLPPWMAFAVSVLGLTIGAIISFFAARYIGRDYVERKYVNHIKWLKDYDRHLEERGFLVVLFLRFIMLIPYEIINIGAGLSRVRFVPYLVGTLLGVIPGAILSIYFVKNVGDFSSWNFIVSSILLVSFSLIPLLIKRVRKIVFNIHSAKMARH